MTEDEYNDSVNKIIKGISLRSAYKFKTIDWEDLCQELWIKVLESEKSKGHRLDLNLVAKICYDYIIDLQRYEIRRVHSSIIDYSDENQSRDVSESLVSVWQLYETFPKDSKESKFLEFWITSAGIHDFGYRPEGRNNDGYTETNLSKLLGFSGTSDRRYKKFRKYMRDIVKKFING